ncbi:hypothetical protein [Streptomyces sp. NPDC054958]
MAADESLQPGQRGLLTALFTVTGVCPMSWESACTGTLASEAGSELSRARSRAARRAEVTPELTVAPISWSAFLAGAT